jgi:Integrase core domain
LQTQEILEGATGEPLEITETLTVEYMASTSASPTDTKPSVPSRRTSAGPVHRRRLRQWARQQAKPAVRPRGWSGQRDRRRLETEVRQGVLEVCHFAAALGGKLPQTATRLGMPERTVRYWDGRARHDQLRPRPRGRPVIRSPRQQRQEVLDFLGEIGPAVGLPTLQASFPALSRAELRDLLGRYRRVWRTRYHETIHVLEWTRPGRVWAIDFAEAPSAIDGTWPYLLAVRDLASGHQLLWQPLGDETAASAVRELEVLFTRHGPPLVLKADNGSAFVAAELKRVACVWGVQLLYSPPWRPSYHGAVEAGIGALKTRTHWQACQAGHAGIWTSADVEAAREQANELARPWGAHGGSPEQVWQARAAVGAAERASFGASVAALEQQERCSRGLAPEQELGHTEEAAVKREAIRRALVAHGLLLLTRRRIPLPILRRKPARIT